MVRRTFELYYSLAAVVAATALYGFLAAREGTPASSGLAGHAIGVVGFLMMLSTETLYSLRKRVRRAPGRLSTWLQIHIFTGIVGPYLVLLHTAWRFQGLAGASMLLTVIVVISGFVGRYIYTAVPRTLDGAEVGLHELQAQIAEADRRLAGLGAVATVEAPGTVPAFAAAGTVLEHGDLGSVLGRPLHRWNYRRRLRTFAASLGPAARADARDLVELLDRRYRLESQVRSLATARRLLALWHTVHIPLGIALFTLAIIHAGAALYYATLLR